MEDRRSSSGPRRHHLTIAAALVVALVGCSGERASSEEPDVATTSASSAATPWRLEELSKWVEPPAQDLDSVLMMDLRRAAEQLGLEPDCSDDDAAGDYMQDMWAEAHVAPFLWRDARDGASSFETEFGLSICDVAASVDARSPREPSAWLVDVPEDQIIAALETDPNWSSELERGTYAGTDFFRWGDSPIGDLSRVSAARPGGYGGQIIVDEDTFVRSSNQPELEALLDAQKAGETLADHESVLELLSFMDGAGAHTVRLYRSVDPRLLRIRPLGAWKSFGELDDALRAGPMLAPYEFFALVVGADGDRDLLTLAVLNDGDDDAVGNTAQLQSVLEAGVRINGGPGTTWLDAIGAAPSYATEGRLSTATFSLERDVDHNPVLWLGDAIERDALRWYAPSS